MNASLIPFSIALSGVLISLVLYVIFGQVTVKKLRKNLKTKDKLGIEFASGWSIMNVAQALSLPRSLTKILDSSPVSYLCANSEVLYKNTSRFDRILARFFYWFSTISSMSLLVLALLDQFYSS